MIGGLIDILTIILFLITIILLFKSKPSDIKNLISRKSSLLIILFILVIITFILRIYYPSILILPLILSIILLFVTFDLDRKITFNKKIDKIKRSLQSNTIKHAEQIKTEQFNFEKEKLALEKQKEKVEEIQLDLENKVDDLGKKAKQIEKLQKNIEKDKKKLSRDFERLKKLQAKKRKK